MSVKISSINELSNIPQELRQAPYWYPCSGKEGITGWNSPEGWLPFEEATEMLGLPKNSSTMFDNLGFNVNPAGIAILDMDHVLIKGTTDWVNEEARNFYEQLLQKYPNIYIERSMGGDGLHLPIKPTPDKFGKITICSNNTWYFDASKDILSDIRNRKEKDYPKLEIFYNYPHNIIFTGNLFNNGECILKYEEADAVIEEILSHTKSKGHGIILNSSKDSSTVTITQTITNISPSSETPLSTTKLADTIPVTENNNILSDIPTDDYLSDQNLEYERDKAAAIVEQIDCSSLERQEWFEVTTVLKKYDLYDVWISWCQTDPERSTDSQDQRENQSTWNSVKDADNYSIGVLVNILKSQGISFNEQDFRKQWLTNHTDTQISDISNLDHRENPLTPNNLFGGDTSDMDNADRIYYENSNIIRYNFESKEFLTFKVTLTNPETGWIQSGVWLSGNQECVYYRVRKLVEDKLIPQAIDTHELAIVKSLKNHKKVTSAINMLKSKEEIWITQADIDNHPELLNIRNGVIDLSTGSLFPTEPSLYLTQQAPVIYDPLITSSPIFDIFMEQILKDECTRAAILRWFGYVITGENKEHKALFIEGSGGNGKGTLCRTIQALLGEYATSFPIEALLKGDRKKDGDAPTPARASLVGKRCAIADELKQDQNLASAEFKLLSGGDRFPYRKLHKDAMVCENPQHKFILSGQFLPDLENVQDEGLQRRLLTVRFPEQFSGARADTNLEKKLKQSESLSGILATLVREAVAYYKDGLLESPAMVEHRQQYIADNNFISEFLEDFTVTAEGKYITSKQFLEKLRGEYDSHCKGFSNRALVEMLKTTKTESHPNGYEYIRRGGNYRLNNLSWKQD